MLKTSLNSTPSEEIMIFLFIQTQTQSEHCPYEISFASGKLVLVSRPARFQQEWVKGLSHTRGITHNSVPHRILSLHVKGNAQHEHISLFVTIDTRN